MFPEISPAESVKRVRQLLLAVGHKEHGFYRPRVLRRRHAEDLRLAGEPLWKILAAGEWRSAVFQAYLGLHKLDIDDAMKGAQGEESENDVEP